MSHLISAKPATMRQYANPFKMVRHLWQQRDLITQFTKRQILQRYKGSYLGVLWSFVTPLVMLLIYTFVFSVVFQARWEGAVTDNHAEFALMLFAGLIAFNVFSEAITTAPSLITSNGNYVKKVVFPLEILPVTNLATALINSFFSLLILQIGMVVFLGRCSWTIILLPLLYIPLTLLCLGLSWFLASLGVFIRDIGPLLGLVVQMLFFLTPIFYPMTAVPENVRFVIYLNPLAFIVNHFRRVILLNQMPDWGEFWLVTAATFIVCMLGYIWFMKSKRVFADVV